MSAASDALKHHFETWITRLGLAWWDIDVLYYDDPATILDKFERDGRIVAALVSADWKYGRATIEVNLTAMADLSPEEQERVVVHELCHILVNEMREGEMHHEERVVTGLTKAFFWVADAVRGEPGA